MIIRWMRTKSWNSINPWTNPGSFPVIYRPWLETDSLIEITDLIHRAFSRLLMISTWCASGLQTPAKTQIRLVRRSSKSALLAGEVAEVCCVLPLRFWIHWAHRFFSSWLWCRLEACYHLSWTLGIIWTIVQCLRFLTGAWLSVFLG